VTRVVAPAPIHKTVRVAVPPDRAFAFFTGRMGRWWRADHSLLKTERADIIVEPRVGGRWYERATDGGECNWGRVLAWEPPHRLLLTWQIDGTWTYNPDLVTEVEIRFVAEGGDATRVELEHRHLERFGDLAISARAALDSPDGWTGALAVFAAIADREA